MGIFGAMTTAISGLGAQSFALENISGNIANSRTTGFKRVDTSFADMVQDLPPRRELSGSVGAYSRNTASIQGDLQASAIATNMGITGDGFFMVRERTGGTESLPSFTGSTLYTRRGDFETNSQGYLVNGTGNYLMGYKVDPITGALSSSVPSPLQVSTASLPAKVTTTVNYQANLPRTPYTSQYTSSNNTPGQELLSTATFLVPGGATVAAQDDTAFQAMTIPGQTVTVYDTSGSPVSVQMRWGKTSNTAGAETWSLYYQSNSTATGATTKWTQVSNNVQFNAAGALTAPATGTIAVPSFTVDGVATSAISLSFGATGLTQRTVESSPGNLTGVSINQDGYSTGTFVDVKVGEGGIIQANYSNNQTVTIARVPVATFMAPNLLKRGDGGTFEATVESGAAIINENGADIRGSTLENSNTDIADEFSKMIVTQQAYSANTKVVTTAQTMLQEVINIIR
jgi:flagellar hook protein FlgE